MTRSATWKQDDIFTLTLPKAVAAQLYWWDMEGDGDVYADIHRQLIEQSVREPTCGVCYSAVYPGDDFIIEPSDHDSVYHAECYEREFGE